MFHPVDPGRLLSGFVGVDPGVTVTPDGFPRQAEKPDGGGLRFPVSGV